MRTFLSSQSFADAEEMDLSVSPSLQHSTQQVAWSVHVAGQAAVILESRTLCCLRSVSRDSDPSGVRDQPTVTLRCTIQRPAGQSTVII